MATLTYREDKSFFDELDRRVEAKESVTIRFASSPPDDKSKLWDRLAQCSNWGDIKAQLLDPVTRKEGPISWLAQGLTGGEIALIVWLSSLLAGLVFYAAYKRMKIKVRVRTEYGDVELELDPA